MSAPRIHRVTGDSKQGRRLRSQNSRRVVGRGLTPEQIAWNARIDAEHQAKKGKPAEPGSALAQARQAAHRSFDPMWQGGTCSRSEAYAWLAQRLGISKADCHIVNFDIAMCERVVAICGVPRGDRILDDFEPL